MSDLFRTLWKEPRAPDAPGPLRRDWALVALLVATAIAETVHGAVPFPPWPTLGQTLGLTLVLLSTLPWRRVHPLRTIVVAFGATGAVHVAALVRDADWVELDTNAFLLILPYALLRWGSGREAILGLATIAASFTAAWFGDGWTWMEGLGASAFVLFPAALGASVRYRDSAQRRATEQVLLREREQLARELHDTVAHHVSAIAIQAQAGLALAATRPGAPVEALRIVEEAASRTLEEMRHILRALRGADAATREPAATLADVQGLARTDGCAPHVQVTMGGVLDEMDTALESTLYRIAQEGVTNAMRHARGARHVLVSVSGEATRVRLTVTDDGDVVPDRPPSGLGLRGMRERVALLGGSLRAGPGAARGWSVEATLPKRGGAA